LGVEQ
jgi:ribonuclease HI